MKKLTISLIAILLIALVVLAGCKPAATGGEEGKGSRSTPTSEPSDSNSELEESIDTAELDDLSVDESLF